MLWLAEGFLSDGYDLDALNKVQQKFAKIDKVPNGYQFTELYMRKEATANQR